jgi:hypothetical protein
MYTVSQINGLGFIIYENEWEDFQKYFDSNNYECFMFCDKEETQEQSFLVYYYFICEKASLIFNQMYLSQPDNPTIYNNDTSVSSMDDPVFKERIEEIISHYHLDQYKQCGYWSVLTSFGIGRIGKNQMNGLDDLRQHYGYP